MSLNGESDTLINELENYYREVREFKAFFVKNCLVTKKYEAFKVWAHWLIRNLCHVNDNYHIIPSPISSQDSDIIPHLVHKGTDEETATKFYEKVIHRITQMYEKYNQLKIDCLNNEQLMKKISQSIVYSVVFDSGTQYHMFKFKDTFIKHNDIKYKKLVASYTGAPECFNFAMFEVGFNYYILDGHSLQWCVPPKTFQILKDMNLGAPIEMFAAPSNATSNLYCALFVIDQKFGALDNFFNLDQDQVLTGIFEVNPPFIENIFIKSSDMVVKFLDNAQKANKDLMFVYIMPDWLDSKGYQKLTQSQYLINEIVLEKNNHYYYQSSNDRIVQANFDTHILVIGTNTASKYWTPKIENEITRSFNQLSKKKNHKLPLFI